MLSLRARIEKIEAIVHPTQIVRFLPPSLDHVVIAPPDSARFRYLVPVVVAIAGRDYEQE
jgi:hypothetical protein